MANRPVLIRKVWGPATVAIVPLVAAAWFLPPGFPFLLRQLLLCAWGVGMTLAAERWLFSDTLREAVRTLGLVRPRTSMVKAAVLVSVPMWLVLPAVLWTSSVAVTVRPDWIQLLAGVVIVNGVTEEVIHRGFVFGHLRRGRPFTGAASLSAILFAAQHFYVIETVGPSTGLASVVLAALLAFPLAYAFERGGNSIGGPAILHTSSNAPLMLLVVPDDLFAGAVILHMAVIVGSLYLLFVFRSRPAAESRKMTPDPI